MVKVGDKIPDVTLYEAAPDKKVSIAKELASGKGVSVMHSSCNSSFTSLTDILISQVIVGVPAAFSPGCSNSHVPGYINSKNLKDAGKVFVVSVNDPFGKEEPTHSSKPVLLRHL